MLVRVIFLPNNAFILHSVYSLDVGFAFLRPGNDIAVKYRSRIGLKLSAISFLTRTPVYNTSYLPCHQ